MRGGTLDARRAKQGGDGIGQRQTLSSTRPRLPSDLVGHGLDKAVDDFIQKGYRRLPRQGWRLATFPC